MRSPLRFFTVDWTWKLIALGVALIVFFGIRKTVSYTQTMVLTVEAEAVDGVQALTGFKPEVDSRSRASAYSAPLETTAVGDG